MSTYFKIVWLISSITILISFTDISAQEPDREQVLADDISRLGERALRDRIISEEEHTQMLCFVRDSLPEGTDLKVRAMEQIRDELDEKYSEQVRQAQKLLDEMGYIVDRCFRTGYMNRRIMSARRRKDLLWNRLPLPGRR